MFFKIINAKNKMCLSEYALLKLFSYILPEFTSEKLKISITEN